MRTDTNKGREILAAIGALGTAGLTALLVYAWGPRPELAAVPDRAQSTGAGNSRMTGQFVEGELHLRRSDGAFIRYLMSTDDTVEATWEMGRFKEKAVMRRVKD